VKITPHRRLTRHQEEEVSAYLGALFWRLILARLILAPYLGADPRRRPKPRKTK
jgi:hypothetical protein